MKNNENGRSMVEMLGVLAIIGVLSAGGLAGYSKAMFKHKLNTTMEQISIIVTNVRTAYGQKGNYTGLDLAKAKKLGAVAESVTANPFKGNIVLASANAAGGNADGTAFTLQYTGIPSEACIALATADFGSGAGSGFIGVEVGAGAAASLKVGGKAGTAATPAVYETGFNATNDPNGEHITTPAQAAQAPVAEGAVYSMAAAVSACKGTEQNTITWKFY